jgi:hypothetical protein
MIRINKTTTKRSNKLLKTNKQMKQFFTLLLTVLITASTFAQVGIGTVNPDASAALEIESTTGGILVPRLTETQRDAISVPATGLMIYQTDGTAGFYYYNGSSWAHTFDTHIDAAGITALGFATAGLVRFPTNSIAGYPDGDGFRRADATTANYGDLGSYAIDLSISDSDTDIHGATGFAAMATGYNVLANGAMATAMGGETVASGERSTAMGNSTTASGKNATAMGESTEATAQNATAMGNSTKATNTVATAMGNNTLASGYNSTAMGYLTTASGNTSTAMGLNTTSSDYGSVVIGQHNSAGATVTSSANLYAFDNTAFVIGNGTDASNPSDAFKVLFNGNTTMAGTLTLGAITLPNADGNANEVLTTDGSGVLAWGAPASGSIADSSVTTAKIANGTIDEIDLDTSVNTSLGFANSALQSFTEVDGSLTNEIQSLSIEGSSLTLSGSNTITIPSGSDDQTATEIAITDSGALITATTVEGALAENRTAIDANENAISTFSAAEDILTTSVANIASAITIETDTARAAEDTLTANVATNATAIAAIKPTTSGTAGQVLTMNADATPIPVWEKPAASGGLLSITEGTNTGYRRADAVAANYGDIGQDAIDLSISESPSTIFGATGNYSLAMGRITTAEGLYSTAMGNFTRAIGIASTAMGGETEALGDYSTAMGYETLASGEHSTAVGTGAIASDYGSVVIGQYNLAGATVTSSATSYAVENTAFVIGNGTDDDKNKSDAFKVLFNGNTTAAGTVTANAFVGDGSGLTNVTASAIADNAITSAKISNGAILNEDISSSAAIDLSKISGLTDALSGKQNTITDDGLTIAQTNGLQDVLDAKAPIDNPIFTGTTVTVNNDIEAKRYVLTAPTAIAATASTTIDLGTGNVITINLSVDTTLTTSNADVVGTYLIKLVQGAGNNYVYFPETWKWSGGSVPTVTLTANKTDIVTLIFDGTNYYAAISQNF